MRKLTIATVVSISFAGIVATLQFNGQSQAQEASAQGVAQKAAEKGVIRESGTIESALSIPLVNKLPGTTTILWLVHDGAAVKKGDVLFELDDSVLQEQLQQQKIKLMQARASAAQAEESLKLHILETEDSLTAAKTSLDVAARSSESVLGEGGELDLKQKELERKLKLLKTKIEMIENRPKNQLEADHIALQYKLTLLDLRNQVDIVQEQLLHHGRHVRPLAVTKHEGEVRIATRHFNRQKAAGEYRTEQLKAAVESARLPFEIEQQHLQEIEESLENCRIVAPRDGTVVYANSSARRTPVTVIGEGVSLRERQRVMTLIDPENRLATLYVHASRLDDLKTGQAATIRVDALADRVISGTVAEIAESPARIRFPAGDERYAVVINIDKPQPELKPGMTCQVEIDVNN